MNVQEMIDFLQTIEDKQMKVCVDIPSYGVNELTKEDCSLGYTFKWVKTYTMPSIWSGLKEGDVVVEDHHSEYYLDSSKELEETKYTDYILNTIPVRPALVFFSDHGLKIE